MFALADINNFFVSCERAFNPKINNIPVVVLSNNDGCIISRSDEAKALGIKMAVPAYQVVELIEQHRVAVFSSNYTLYGDMSARVMATLNLFVQDMEIYSIDEAFLDLHGFEHMGWRDYGEKIIRTVNQHTHLPISMGIAPTKTLAKTANKFAKKYKGYNNLCIMDTEEKIIKALQLTDISDIWGVGRRLTRKMNGHGMFKAYDITQATRSFMRKHYTVAGERLWNELQGIKCYEIEHNPPTKKGICTSRSFGKYVEDYESLRESVSSYAAVCAEKLRQQNTFAISLMVYIHTNRFNENHLQHAQSCVIKLPVATNSTLEIVKCAVEALHHVYRKGYKYSKAGVIITEIGNFAQLNAFRNIDIEKHNRLMKVIDKYNKGFVSDKIKLAVQGSDDAEWKIKRDYLSPCYTTNLKDVIRINCKV